MRLTSSLIDTRDCKLLICNRLLSQACNWCALFKIENVCVLRLSVLVNTQLGVQCILEMRESWSGISCYTNNKGALWLWNTSFS